MQLLPDRIWYNYVYLQGCELLYIFYLFMFEHCSFARKKIKMSNFNTGAGLGG